MLAATPHCISVPFYAFASAVIFACDRIDLMPLRLLPREAQIRFTLFTPLDKDHDYEKELQSLPEHATSPLVEGVYALSCVSVPVFNFRG